MRQRCSATEIACRNCVSSRILIELIRAPGTGSRCESAARARRCRRRLNISNNIDALPTIDLDVRPCVLSVRRSLADRVRCDAMDSHHAGGTVSTALRTPSPSPHAAISAVFYADHRQGHSRSRRRPPNAVIGQRRTGHLGGVRRPERRRFVAAAAAATVNSVSNWLLKYYLSSCTDHASAADG